MVAVLHILYWIDLATIFVALGLASLIMLVIWHGLHENFVRPFEPRDDVPDGQPDS